MLTLLVILRSLHLRPRVSNCQGASASTQVGREGFAGAAGQKVALEVSGSTFEDQCGFAELVPPNSNAIASACSISGRGSIEAMALPVTGQYTILVNASGAGTGSVRLRLLG
jgi:hypothetical protein